MSITMPLVPPFSVTAAVVPAGVVTGNVVPSVKDIRHPALVGQLIGAAVLPVALTLK